MEKRQFIFKREYFQIKGIYNIPGLIICSGHGYGFYTYCCMICGEIFVVDEQLIKLKGDLNEIIKHKLCPTCGTGLDNNLVKYPENVFYNGTIHPVVSEIDYSHFEETELIDTPHGSNGWKCGQFSNSKILCGWW
jgi:hypothetical protein